MRVVRQKETLQAFLARGGRIERVPLGVSSAEHSAVMQAAFAEAKRLVEQNAPRRGDEPERRKPDPDKRNWWLEQGEEPVGDDKLVVMSLRNPGVCDECLDIAVHEWCRNANRRAYRKSRGLRGLS